MASRLETKPCPDRSHQTPGHVIITVAPYRTSKIFYPQPTAVSKRMTWEEEELEMEKRKHATTGRWVLNVIAAQEAYEKGLKDRKRSQNNKSKLLPRKSSRIGPMDASSQSPFVVAPSFYPDYQQNFYSPHPSAFSPTYMEHGSMTHSSVISMNDDHYHHGKSLSKFDDYSTEQFEDGDKTACVSKRTMIILTVTAIVFIVGILLAVFLTIFVGKTDSNGSTSGSSNSKSIDLKSMCPTSIFSLPSTLCHQSKIYSVYSCFYWVTSPQLTLRFLFDNDLFNDHWYIDDVSVIQNDTNERIMNGGFESDATGWIMIDASNKTLPSSIDHQKSFAHTGSAYFHRQSSSLSITVEQTMKVISNEYVHLSFWWKTDRINRCPTFRIQLIEPL